jgi:hypothetical protein
LKDQKSPTMKHSHKTILFRVDCELVSVRLWNLKDDGS